MGEPLNLPPSSGAWFDSNPFATIRLTSPNKRRPLFRSKNKEQEIEGEKLPTSELVLSASSADETQIESPTDTRQYVKKVVESNLEKGKMLKRLESSPNLRPYMAPPSPGFFFSFYFSLSFLFLFSFFSLSFFSLFLVLYFLVLLIFYF